MDLPTGRPSWEHKMIQLLQVLFNPSYNLKEDRDDTLFERFLSTLDEELDRNKGYASHLLHDSTIQRSVSAFFSTRDVDPLQISSSLRTLAVIVKHCCFKEFAECHRNVLDWLIAYFKGQKDDSGITLAVLHFLQNLLPLSGSDVWMAECGGISFLVKSLDNKCLFVRNGSKDVLSKCIIRVLEKNMQNREFCVPILKQLFDVATNTALPISAIMSLTDVCRQSSSACNILIEDLDSKSTLIAIIKENECSSVEIHIATLLAILFSSDTKVQTADELIADFIASKNYQAAISFSSEVLKNKPDTPQVMQALVGPVTSVLNPFQSKYKFDLESVEVKLAKKLIYSSISCLTSCCFHKPCPVTYSHFLAILSVFKMSFSEKPLPVLQGDKFRFCCLDFFYKYHENNLPMDKDAVDDLLSSWVQIITTCATNCPLVFESIKWLGRILCTTEGDLRNYETMGEVENLLNWHFMDTRWEVQDSIIELINYLVVAGKNDVQEWLIQQKYHLILCDLIMTSSPNSYVIASSLQAILSYLDVKSMKEVLLRDLSLSRDKFYDQVVTILDENEDYIIRRSASLVLASYRLTESDTDYKTNKILLTMILICQHDLDWTVKLNALSFWEKMLEDVNVTDEMKSLENNGFVTSIISCFHDHEITVKERACDILREIQSRFKIQSNEELARVSPPDEENLIPPVSSPIIGTSVADRESAIDDVLNIDESYRLVRLLRPESANRTSLNEKTKQEVKHYSVQDLDVLLRSTNFRRHCAEFEKRAETYHNNFSSLITDLFDCLVVLNDNRNDVVADCY